MLIDKSQSNGLN